MKYCPDCGTPIADHAFFCYHCGKSLRICLSCSFEIPRDVPIEAVFCPNCGQRLSWIKWSVGDAFKVFIFSIFFLIPSILLLSLVFAPFVMIAGIEVPFFITLSSNHLLLLMFTLYYIQRRGGSLREVGIALAKPRFIAIGVLTGIAVLVLNVIVSILTEPFIGASPIQEELVRIGEAQDGFPIFFLFVSVIAPMIEEIYSRGFSYQAFKKRWGSSRGILISATYFAFLHLDPWAFFKTLMIGVVLAYVYEKTNSLPLVIVAHSLNNALAFFV